MEAKPWEVPSFFKSNTHEYDLRSIDGLLVYMQAIIAANEWRRSQWKADYPGNDQLIDARIDDDNKRLQIIIDRTNDFRFGVKDLPNRGSQEQFYADTLMLGMVVNSICNSWILPAAEKGVAREAGQIKAKQVNKKDWAELQWQAKVAISAVDGDPEYDSKEKLYAAAGKLMEPQVSASTFRNYLNGKRR